MNTDSANAAHVISKKGSQKRDPLHSQFQESHPRPKKPKNAFVLFAEAQRPHLKIQPGENKMKKLAQLWAEAPESTKKKFRDLAAPDEERFRREMQPWLVKRSSFTRKNTIKKPSKPFIFFRSELCHKRREKSDVNGQKNMDGKDISKEAKNKWAQMSDSERKPYFEMATRDLDRYEQEIQEKKDHLVMSFRPAKKAWETEKLPQKHSAFDYFVQLQAPGIYAVQKRPISQFEMKFVAKKMWAKLSNRERSKYQKN